MAADDSGEIPKLTGIKKYFNSYTKQGKANVAFAVYGSMFLGYLYYKFRSPKSKPQ